MVWAVGVGWSGVVCGLSRVKLMGEVEGGGGGQGKRMAFVAEGRIDVRVSCQLMTHNKNDAKRNAKHIKWKEDSGAV